MEIVWSEFFICLCLAILFFVKVGSVFDTTKSDKDKASTIVKQEVNVKTPWYPDDAQSSSITVWTTFGDGKSTATTYTPKVNIAGRLGFAVNPTEWGIVDNNKYEAVKEKPHATVSSDVSELQKFSYIEGVMDTHAMSFKTVMFPVAGSWHITRRDGSSFERNYNAGEIVPFGVIEATRKGPKK